MEKLRQGPLNPGPHRQAWDSTPGHLAPRSLNFILCVFPKRPQPYLPLEALVSVAWVLLLRNFVSSPGSVPALFPLFPSKSAAQIFSISPTRLLLPQGFCTLSVCKPGIHLANLLSLRSQVSAFPIPHIIQFIPYPLSPDSAAFSLPLLSANLLPTQPHCQLPRRGDFCLIHCCVSQCLTHRRCLVQCFVRGNKLQLGGCRRRDQPHS